jgi:hypothetical protein
VKLIEFFCNQRKTGRLEVVYPVGPGHFYLKSGSVVHAELGELRGIDAIYFALTQPNASFTFSASFEPPEQNHQSALDLSGIGRFAPNGPGNRATQSFSKREAGAAAEKKTVVEPAPVARVAEVPRPKAPVASVSEFA